MHLDIEVPRTAKILKRIKGSKYTYGKLIGIQIQLFSYEVFWLGTCQEGKRESQKVAVTESRV